MKTFVRSLSLTGFSKATGYAIAGVAYAFRSEPSFARIAIAAFAIAALGWYLSPLPSHKIALLVVSVALILIAELVNTSIEILVDMVQPERDERVKRIKDCAAGATFVASCSALIVCVLITLN